MPLDAPVMRMERGVFMAAMLSAGERRSDGGTSLLPGGCADIVTVPCYIHGSGSASHHVPGSAALTVASMTGFARAAGQRGGWSWTWELKSVNGKSLDLRLRLTPGHDRLEMPVREAVGKRFRRGNLTLVLTLARSEGEVPFRVNREQIGRAHV